MMRIVSVNISREKGTVKTPVEEIRIDESGVEGDAHAGAWHRQVSLLSEEIITGFEAETGKTIRPGEFAENVTVRGIDLRSVCISDTFTSGTLEMEVTQIGKACHGEECAIFREVGKCVMPQEGIFCRVRKGGMLKPGDLMEHHPGAIRFRIITLSDRASRGEYEDRSGPRIRELLEDFLEGKRWRPEIEAAILPDDAAQLEAGLADAREAGVDVVFTTGGTGVGPRDVTPEVVTSLADKIIPGIMEHIRAKCAERNPNALLSRGVAAVMGKTLVYALPGSLRAVEEYMAEILKTLEHLVFTVRGMERH